MRQRAKNSRPPASRNALGRALRYLSRYRREAAMPYLFLIIATLSQLDDPEKLGHGIAAAFIATFWGVFLANGLFLPWSNKLKALSKEEVEYKNLIIEGVLSIQAGSNPRVVAEMLKGFLPPAAREGIAEETKKAS